MGQMYAWATQGQGAGEGLAVGQFRLQMLPGGVPGGPLRGSNLHSLKELNRFQKGKECSPLKDRRSQWGAREWEWRWESVSGLS